MTVTLYSIFYTVQELLSIAHPQHITSLIKHIYTFSFSTVSILYAMPETAEVAIWKDIIHDGVLEGDDSE